QTNSAHVGYRLSDVDFDAPLACGAEDASSSAPTRGDRRHSAGRRGADSTGGDSFSGPALQATGGFLNTQIALVGDYEYFTKANWPSAHTASSWLAAIINAVSGIYESE